MTTEFIVGLARETMWTALWVVGPVMAVGFLVGILVSLLQAVMQMQEMTIGFVPKIIAICVTLVVSAHWMLNHLMTYTRNMLGNFAQYIQ